VAGAEFDTEDGGEGTSGSPLAFPATDSRSAVLYPNSSEYNTGCVPEAVADSRPGILDKFSVYSSNP